MGLMHICLIAGLIAGTAAAQTPDTTLPSLTVGIGPSWTRGDTYAASADVDLAIRLGNSSVYSWSTISTPVATVPAASRPLPSTVTTGLAYVPARSPSGAVSLVTLAQTGFNQVPPSGPTTVAFTGSLGVAFRLGKSNVYLMPYIKASKPAAGTDGALVSAIVQPGAMIILGFFGGK